VNWALKFKKSANTNMDIETTKNLMLISKLLRKIQKSYSKKSVQNWSLSFSLLLICKKFLQITISTDLKSAKKNWGGGGVIDYICI
jgi:hypothetical protein